MSEQPLIINRETKKIEKATGLEDYFMDMQTIFSEENISTAINNYFANLPEGEQEWITDEVEVGEDNLTIKFFDLYTDDGDTRLPLEIKYAKVSIWAVNNDSGVFVHSGSVTNREFTVSRKTGIQEDVARVQFIIRGMVE